MKFYLNNQEVKVETNGVFIETMDESLDTGSFTLEWNSNPNAIAPMTPFRIEHNGDVWNFVVIKDDVEIVKRKPPMLYAHHITIEQNTIRLSNHILRNTNFSQPFNKNKKARFIMSFVRVKDVDGVIENRLPHKADITSSSPDVDTIYYYQERINLSAREKIANAYVRINGLTNLYTDIQDLGTEQRCDTPSTWQNTLSHYEIKVKQYRSSNDALLSTQVYDLSPDTDTTIQVEARAFDTYFLIDLVGDENFAFTSDSQLLPYDDDHSRFDNALLVRIECSLVVETYYYSILDVLRGIQKQSAKKYVFGGNTYQNPLFSVPNSELDQVIAPEFSFNGKDVFTAISETLSYVDAVPTLTTNNQLGYEYLNDVAKVPSTIILVDKQTTIDYRYYNNRLTSTYQNARLQNKEVYPAYNLYRRINANVYGIPNAENYQFEVPFPIDYIDKVQTPFAQTNKFQLDIFVQVISGTQQTWHFRDCFLPVAYIDLTPVVYEETERALFDLGMGNNYVFPSQLGTLGYQKGGRSINLGGIYTSPSNFMSDQYKWAYWVAADIYMGRDVNLGDYPNTRIFNDSQDFTDLLPIKQNLYYNIEYHAIHDGRFSIESTDSKYNGESFVGQSNASVELNRMGRQMEGLIARLGTEQRTLALTLDSFDNRLKKGSLWVDSNGNKYIANSVKVSFSTDEDKVITEVEFVKNFNAISQFTGLDQEKRFYEISNQLTTKGYETLNTFIYVSLTNPQINGETLPFTSDLRMIVGNTFTLDTNDYLDIVAIDTFDQDGDLNPYVESILCPLYVYGAGNTLCFEIGFEHPTNAGDYLVGSGTSSSPYLNKPTIYAKDGFADIITIHSGKTSSLSSSATLPTLQSAEWVDLTEFDYYYYKKPNEIFRFTYGISFIPYNNQEIYTGEKMLTENGMIRGIRRDKTFYLYYSSNENDRYSINETKPMGTKIALTIANGGTANHVYRLNMTLNESVNAKTWAIVDESDNIYICSNESFNSNTFTLYFMGFNERI